MKPCAQANGGYGQRCVGLNPWSPSSPSFYPLRGNTFLGYSGMWGDPNDQASGFGVPPRGPVFQGFDNGVYTAWYNEASADAASPSWVPWLRPHFMDTQLVSDLTHAAGTAKLGPSGLSVGPLANTSDTPATVTISVLVQGVSAAASARTRRVLGRAKVRLAPGQRVPVRVRLSRSAQRLVHRARGHVLLELRVSTPTMNRGRTVTRAVHIVLS